jgi:hypothetical protein
MDDTNDVQTTNTVWVNDIWVDLDPRSNGRQLKVLSIEPGFAIVQHPSGAGSKRKIRLDRFRSNKTGKRGYRLVERNGVAISTAPSTAVAA